MNVSGKNIALVTGLMQDEYAMQLVKAIAKSNNVTIFCFNSYLNNFSANFGQKIVVFTELPDMLGYMRGLEKRLEDFDAIVVSGTSSLSSFQASRVAHKFKIPMLALTCQTAPTTNRGFANLEAIQFDVFEHSSLIFTPTERARSRAILDGASEEKLVHLPFNFVDEKFLYCERNSSKLRNYLKIPLNIPVILAEFDVQLEKQFEAIMLSIRMLKVTRKAPPGGLKLLLWNTETISKFLKNRAFELGLSDTVLFLEQDIAPFAHDLFCAADFSLSQEKNLDVDDGMTGINEKIELAGAKTIALTFQTLDYGQIANAISSQLAGVESADQRSLRSAQILRERQEKEWVQDTAVDEHLFKVLTKSEKTQSIDQDILDEAEKILSLQKPFSAQKETDLKEKVLAFVDTARRSQGFALLGDFARATHRYDEACEYYSKSIDSLESSRAFSGLGHISSYAQSFEEAMVFYKKATSLSPDNLDSKFGMAVCLYKLSIFEESILWLNRCLASDPENKAYLGLFISCALKLRNTDEAIDYLEGLLDKGASRNSVYLHLATLYEKKGDYVKSCELMNQYSAKAG